MSAPVPEEDFREIQLSGKQLVFLAMSMTVVLVVTFLLGVVVGRRVPAETLLADATAFEGLAPDGGPVALDPGQPPAEPPPPVTEEPDQFSYHERLQQSAPTEEKLPAASAPPPPAASAPDPDPPAPAASGTWVAQIGAYKDRATAESIADTLKRNDFPAFVLAPTPGSPTATFRVRVGPYRERREAEAIAGRLKREHQFTPFVTR
jgi:cell division septation protein DedD